MSEFNGFPKDFFNFFNELKNNNNREWFADNKARYYDSVVNPMGEFIVADALELPFCCSRLALNMHKILYIFTVPDTRCRHEPETVNQTSKGSS